MYSLCLLCLSVCRPYWVTFSQGTHLSVIEYGEPIRPDGCEVMDMGPQLSFPQGYENRFQ